MSGDHQAIDSHEEDLAAPILTQGLIALGAEAGTDFVASYHDIDFNVKTHRKLIHAKQALVLLLDAGAANRARFTCSIRAVSQLP